MNLRHFASLLVATSVGFPSAACSFLTYETIYGDGEPVSEPREVVDFDAVAVAGSFAVNVDVVETEAAAQVSIEAQANLQPYIETRVEGGTLEVRVREGYRVSPRPRIVVRTGDLNAIEIAGSADVVASGLSGEEFSVEIAGSGNVRATGTVDELEIEIAGSGEVRTVDLATREARVSIAGSGDVELHVAEALEINIAGSGDVRYRGDPTISQSVAGSGRISRFPAE